MRTCKIRHTSQWLNNNGTIWMHKLLRVVWMIKISLTSLKGEERGLRQGQSNEIWKSNLIGWPKVRSFTSKWSSSLLMSLSLRVWSNQGLSGTKSKTLQKWTQEGLKKGEEWGGKERDEIGGVGAMSGEDSIEMGSISSTWGETPLKSTSEGSSKEWSSEKVSSDSTNMPHWSQS